MKRQEIKESVSKYSQSSKHARKTIYQGHVFLIRHNHLHGHNCYATRTFALIIRSVKIGAVKDLSVTIMSDTIASGVKTVL